MTSSPDNVRKPMTAGTRAVGFRAPAQRKSNPLHSSNSTTLESESAQPQPSKAMKSSQTNLPLSSNAASASALRSAPPVKKRPKGKSFFGFVFLMLVGSMIYFAWSNFLQFQSYGVIDGRIIAVAAPWDGTISNWQVRDGEVVQQGDIVATMSNLSLQHELAALSDKLNMTQANLDAEMAKMKFDTQGHHERGQKAMAEYLQAAGELQSEQANFSDMERQLDRGERLYKSKNLSKSEYEKLYFQFVGQQRKIEKLEAAVEVLQQRSKDSSQQSASESSQLKPLLANIARTQSEMSRLREKLDQGQIKAPISGRVTKRFCLTGEAADEGEPIVEILEDNSIEAVLYVPQSITDEFAIGNEIEILLEPNRQAMLCQVKRLGDRFEPAPKSIARYYSSEQYLLPVYLTPQLDFDQALSMRVHGTVKRPYEWTKSLEKAWTNVKTHF